MRYIQLSMGTGLPALLWAGLITQVLPAGDGLPGSEVTLGGDGTVLSVDDAPADIIAAIEAANEENAFVATTGDEIEPKAKKTPPQPSQGGDGDTGAMVPAKKS